jgi:hypothetical protein
MAKTKTSFIISRRNISDNDLITLTLETGSRIALRFCDINAFYETGPNTCSIKYQITPDVIDEYSVSISFTRLCRLLDKEFFDGSDAFIRDFFDPDTDSDNE